MYTAQDVMTENPVTLTEVDPMSLAETIFYLGRVRHLPVVRKGKLVGLVTHRDLLRAYAKFGEAKGPTMLAAEVMQAPIAQVRPNTLAKDAFKLMLKRKYGCMPVVEKDGTLTGIITEADGVSFALRVINELDRITVINKKVGRKAG
jgi:CBS domain-containing membrane protein